MRRTAGIATLALVLALARGAEEDADTYAIYSILLREEMPSVQWWNIRNETGRGPLSMCIQPPADQEAAYRPVIDDFEKRNGASVALEKKFDLPAYELVPRGERILPLFEVSAIGFNRERTIALVYVGHHCGPLCGGGSYHLMARKNGKWEADTEFRGGPSCAWKS